MEYRRGIMKVSLAENLRELMVKHLFEKITIKQICDETGVIRATFYNYFDDKYDCLNWIVYHDFVENNTELLEEGSFDTLFHNVLKTIDENRNFYRAAYNNVTGQNSFEDMVRSQLKDMVLTYFNHHRKEAFLHKYDNEIISRYYAEGIAFILKTFVFEKEGRTIDETIDMAKELLSDSFFDYVNDTDKQ